MFWFRVQEATNILFLWPSVRFSHRGVIQQSDFAAGQRLCKWKKTPKHYWRIKGKFLVYVCVCVCASGWKQKMPRTLQMKLWECLRAVLCVCLSKDKTVDSLWIIIRVLIIYFSYSLIGVILMNIVPLLPNGHIFSSPLVSSYSVHLHSQTLVCMSVYCLKNLIIQPDKLCSHRHMNGGQHSHKYQRTEPEGPIHFHPKSGKFKHNLETLLEYNWNEVKWSDASQRLSVKCLHCTISEQENKWKKQCMLRGLQLFTPKCVLFR